MPLSSLEEDKKSQTATIMSVLVTPLSLFVVFLLVVDSVNCDEDFGCVMFSLVVVTMLRRPKCVSCNGSQVMAVKQVA